MATIAHGLFWVLDGLDGAGKSTQLELLESWLKSNGRRVVRCRDPGGTPLGERIRSLLLNAESKISMPAETLLYLASRAQLMEDVIRPALERGEDVLCDRFESATLAYQGYAGGVDVAAIREASKLARGVYLPNWIGILDLPAEVALARLNASPDRIESRPAEYHAAVRNGFLMEAKRDPQRYAIIDAGQAAAIVHQYIIREVERVIAAHRT